jgi:DNA-binding IscR family transcriptional regulator
VAHGILGSTRGVEGGYTLERSPAEISLLEVIEAIEGPLVSALPVGEGLPQDSRNRLEQALFEVNANARRELESIKLVHLLRMPEKKPNGQNVQVELPSVTPLAPHAVS